MGNGNGGGGGSGAPGPGDADAAYGGSFGGIGESDSSYGGQGQSAAEASAAAEAGQFGGMNEAAATAGLGDPGNEGQFGGMSTSASDSTSSDPTSPSLNQPDVVDPQQRDPYDIPAYEYGQIYDQMVQDQAKERDIMGYVAQVLGVMNPFLGLAMYGVNQMAASAQAQGQVGSNVAGAMGLGAEPGGLGGPGGGGQWDDRPLKQVSSPAPQMQKPQSSTEQKNAKADIKKAVAARRGRKSTLLTGGKGILGDPNVDLKTLLGWARG